MYNFPTYSRGRWNHNIKYKYKKDEWRNYLSWDWPTFHPTSQKKVGFWSGSKQKLQYITSNFENWTSLLGHTAILDCSKPYNIGWCKFSFLAGFIKLGLQNCTHIPESIQDNTVQLFNYSSFLGAKFLYERVCSHWTHHSLMHFCLPYIVQDNG